MTSKTEIIKKLNEIQKVPLADLKKDPVENSSGTKHRDLMTYNAMLDNITIGTGTTTTFFFAGIDWTFRLLNADEFISIKKEVILQAKNDSLFDDWYTYYLLFLKTLARALSPSQFKTEGKAIFNENDLKQINYDVLEELYRRYNDFVYVATKKVEEYTDEEVERLIAIVKKKPGELTELSRPQLLIVSNYYINYSQQLEKMLKPDLDN